MTWLSPDRYWNASRKSKRESFNSHIGDSLVWFGERGIKQFYGAVLFNTLVNWTGEGKWDEWPLSPFPFIFHFWHDSYHVS